MNRRKFLKIASASPYFINGQVTASSTLRIGLTPVILDDKLNFLNRWSNWLSSKSGYKVEFVQRAQYQEIMNLLHQGDLDLAWVCGYPLVKHFTSLNLELVPIYNGKPLYQAYIISRNSDKTINEIVDFENKVFTFSDPLSNSGYLFPRYRLLQLGHDLSLFRKSFFSWGHKHVIESVAAGLADGGSVDGYIWDQLSLQHPELTSQTKVIERSPPFGFPPIVSSSNFPNAKQKKVKLILSRMHQDKEGSLLLKSLGLDQFSEQKPMLFKDIANMAFHLGERLEYAS